MDVANLLSHDPPRPIRSQQAADTPQTEAQRAHQYPTRHSLMSNNVSGDPQYYMSSQTTQAFTTGSQQASPHYKVSPETTAPKNVAFELLFDGGSSHRARLPMRVQIFPHDTTDSIITTVKNFYGLYEGAAKGVSFEDQHGNILIARYENLQNNMVVYVRINQDYSQTWQQNGQTPVNSTSPISAHRVHALEAPFQMLPPQPAQVLNYGQSISRPGSRVARKKSASPRRGGSNRSASTLKGRSRTGAPSREDNFQHHLDNLNSDTGKDYGSSDGEAGSVSSSRKARSEQLATAEISLDNILEGNRRKRAKFESSVSHTSIDTSSRNNNSALQELPLFVPPQVPAANSISSISPQRRSNGQDNSPFTRPEQRTFVQGQPLQSPQNYGYGDQTYGIISHNTTPFTGAPSMQHGRRLRDRTNVPSLSARTSTGMVPRVQGFGILPTPDPTIASCISDEDVALQLMRLGDASNISHGRTSASTLDETLSGRADVASSVTSDSDEESNHTEQLSLPLPQPHTESRSGPASQPSIRGKPRKYIDDGLPSVNSTEPDGDDVDNDYVYDDKVDGVFKSDPDDLVNEFGQANDSKPVVGKPRNNLKSSSILSSRNGPKSTKSKNGGVFKKAKSSNTVSANKVPATPGSLPSQSRKASTASAVNFHHQGEEDLSTKPRCQRCRKSKKGCDRQRPCQRCKDAGIGIEGCISEDEGNGRKGRFGRHMGVTVQQDDQTPAPFDIQAVGASVESMGDGFANSKKRKR